MLFKLEIGDYSEDGYGVHEPVIYETNYDVAAIAEGYRKSCKKYGIQFNRGDNDFTGLGLKCWDKRALWSNPDMGACWLDEKMHDLLTHTGVVPEEDMMSLEGEYLANYDSGPDEYANAIMRFIALSMPDDFTYRIQEPENIPCLNDTWESTSATGCWCRNLDFLPTAEVGGFLSHVNAGLRGCWFVFLTNCVILGVFT